MKRLAILVLTAAFLAACAHGAFAPGTGPQIWNYQNEWERAVSVGK